MRTRQRSARQDAVLADEGGRAIRGRWCRRWAGVALLLGLLPAVARAQAGDTLALRLPPDARFAQVVGAESLVVFRHGTHVPLAGKRCRSCHPVLFPILTPTTTLSHRGMDAGAACGACHDGEHAFSTRARESCALCHVGRAAADAAAAARGPANAAATSFRGPKPIRYPQGDVSPGAVTFRHATHAKGACSECHPRWFAMQPPPATPRGGYHESARCGACHNGRRSFACDDANACMRCHHEEAR